MRAYLLCILLLSSFLLFALWVAYLTRRPLLPSLPFRLSFSPLFLALRPATPYLPFLFLLRRLAFALTLTIVPPDYPQLQLISLMMQ